MGVQGLGQMQYGFTSDYRIADIKKVDVNTSEEVKEQNGSPNNLADITSTQENTVPQSTVQQKSVNPSEVSLTFDKNSSFSYIGSESSLDNLDMQKAISDMKQDSVLAEYQYFVGSAKNIFQSEDGMVLSK